MGLFDSFKKKRPTAQPKVVVKTTSHDEDMTHLTEEGDLPWGWRTANKDFISKIGAEYNFFFQRWLDSRDKDPVTQYAELKSFVLYMEDVKKLCASMGECFNYWRGDLFMDDYLETRTREMKYIESNIDKLESEYKRKVQIEQEILPDLRERLLAIISVSPEILQTDVYKMFDEDVKPYISQELYHMEKAWLITREKKGRSYSLKAI